MALYSFIAIDSAGERLAGQIEASDPDAVVSRLTAQGLRTESVQLARKGPHPEALLPQLSGGLRPAEAREVGGHIAEIVAAGMPLETGLAAVVEELPRGRLKRQLRRIVAELETGRDLESVLRGQHSPAYLPALVRAGRQSGRTAEILESFVSGARIVFELRQTLALAMVYPVSLLIVVLIIVGILQYSVIPEFASIFEGFGIQLPWLTRVLVGASKFLSQFGWLALAVVAGAALLICLLTALLLGPVETRRVVCRLPIIGPLLRWTALARFSPLLALLIESRVPLDEALVLAGDAAGDALIRADSRKLAERIRAGETLESAARSGGGLPVSFVQALSFERQRRGLPEVLQSMADIYAGRARAVATLLSMLLPMLVVLVVASLVGLVVAGLMWPLLVMISKLS